MKQFLAFSFIVLSMSLNAQQMTNTQLKEILIQESDTIVGNNGRWQMTVNELPMMILTDSINDRMRIIAPVAKASSLDKDLLLDCLTANFHSALDVKYAISDDLLWTVYIHPLSPLTEMEVTSAVRQVYAATTTFGTTFSSTPLLFGGNNVDQTPQEEKKTTIKLKKT